MRASRTAEWTPAALRTVQMVMVELLRRLLLSEAGQDVIEYALLTAAVGLAGIATWPALVTAIGNAYQALDGNTQNIWEVPNPGGAS